MNKKKNSNYLNKYKMIVQNANSGPLSEAKEKQNEIIKSGKLYQMLGLLLYAVFPVLVAVVIVLSFIFNIILIEYLIAILLCSFAGMAFGNLLSNKGKVIIELSKTIKIEKE